MNAPFLISFLFIVASGSPFSLNHKSGSGACFKNVEQSKHQISNFQFSSLRIIDSIPAPPGEMKMGLTEDNNHLWIFTNNTNSYSIFYKIRKNDGLIIRQFNFPDTTPRYNIGLTMINGYLYTTEFYPTSGDIHILDTLGNLIRTFNTGYNTRGLTWDGTNLWTTEADSMSILKMDTLGNLIAIYKNNGIQWFMDITYDPIDSTIWANDDAFALTINEIAVDSSPFNIIQSFDHPAPDNDIPEGITYSTENDGGYLYTTAAYSQIIWKIKVYDGSIEEKNIKNNNLYCFQVLGSNLITNQVCINFKIPKAQRIKLIVYGIDGRTVQTIRNGVMPAGEYNLFWNCTPLAFGIYFIRFETPVYKSTIKVVKIK